MDKSKEVELLMSDEIKKTYSYLSEHKVDYAAEQFFNTVRLTFATIFDINFQFTFEELIHKLNHMEDSLEEIDAKIKEIKKKIEAEYTKKKKTGIKALKRKIKELNQDLNQELKKEKELARLNQTLLENNFKEQLISFSRELSEMKYSEDNITEQKLISLIKRFEGIIDRIYHKESVVEKKGSFSLPSFSLTHYLENLLNRNHVPTVLRLLKLAEVQMNENKVAKAKLTYRKILKLYFKMPYKDKKTVYVIILDLFNYIKSES